MKKITVSTKIICGLLLAFIFGLQDSLSAQNSSAAGEDLVWLVVQGDIKSGRAGEESWWGWSRSPKDIVCKKFKVDIALSDIKAFKLHYKMGHDPYDPVLKQHTAKELGNISIYINDKPAVNKPAAELAGKGWHSLNLKPAFLKSGENTVKFTWTVSAKGRYGIFYMAIDNSRRTGRSSASGDKGLSFHTESLQAGGKPRDKTQGELLIAVELGLEKKNKTEIK
ncbi:MAG: hypothetical protein WCS27_17440 [Victivallaceae bacterium]